MFKDIRNTFYDKTDEQKERTLAYRKRKIIKSGSDMFYTMCNVVEINVKRYKADFYIHDIASISEYPDDSFIWVVRTNGTHYINLNPESNHEKFDPVIYFDAVVHNSGSEIKRIYYVKDGKLKRINKSQTKEILSDYEKAY